MRRALALSERLYRLGETALAPGGVRALCTWRPMSVAAFGLVRSLHDAGMSFATVLDVGANAGQFARASLGRWPGAHVIAFEPQSDIAARLEATVGRVGRIEVHAMALGAEDGTTGFRRHAHDLSSSILPPAKDLEGEAWAVKVAELTIPLGRLDTVLAGRRLGRSCLLKIDAQGFELEVITGAATILDQVDAVLVEAAFEPRYVGQPAFSVVHEALRALGWSLVRPLDFHRGNDGRILEGDMLYERRAGRA